MSKPNKDDKSEKIPLELKGRVPTLAVIAMPENENPSGDIFGGWLMAQMDLAAADKALDTVKGRVATRAVQGMEFHKPVMTGDKLFLYTDVRKVGNTSITVHVESWAKRRSSGDYEKVTEGTFTFVRIDNKRRPVPIGPRP
jgi:acyl-CoA thioesterase YciA